MLTSADFSIERLRRLIQRSQQVSTVVEIAFKIELGDQQAEILKVEWVERRSQEIAFARNMLPVGDGVAVVGAKLVVGKRPSLVVLGQASDELVDEVGAAVTGPPLQFRRAQHPRKTVEIANAQLLQGPAGQHQLIGKVGRHWPSVSESWVSNISKGATGGLSQYCLGNFPGSL